MKKHNTECQCFFCSASQRIGFVSTRIAGTDGVSLETYKWSRIFNKQRFKCFYFAGELETPAERSYLSEKSHFRHPEIRKIFRSAFGRRNRMRSTTKKIHSLKEELKDDLYDFINKFNISLLVPQNALTIPMNIPLGLALTEVISETGIPVIAHHHDFFWERTNFLTNSVWEYLNMAFPPHLPSMHHVVINSSANNQLGLRTGASSTVIPNVMDFDIPPPPVDDFASDVREAFGVKDDEFFILQPTRVIKRKGIELAIELVSRLGLRCKLIISHASGDEGFGYEKRIIEYSKIMNVDTVFVSKRISEKRGHTKNGEKIYTLDDVYPHADLVTYPSNYEGFGNAFLEAIYFCKPIVVNTYSIYSIDIKPKGFKVIELDGYVTQKAVEQTKKVLNNSLICEDMTRHNYDLARRFYSYSVLEKKLLGILESVTPCTTYLSENNNTYQ
ncbi:MAG: glycosyltransferase family 4 protein [Desulfobacteraceae bacterium]|nr:glycosyltransferase family 4 protein [Desulfobacteraceae bacterium]MBC2757516.1 glycosyltransferase family 4 protein [Desulfobacteraceae bacterium]